jgi:predicted hotdog family 3-hydroxylacyl-ACP dehydratase
MKTTVLILMVLLLVACVPYAEQSELKFEDLRVPAGRNIGSDNLTLSQEAFKDTVYPLTRSHCITCHATHQHPLHAHVDVKLAHDMVINNFKVNFDNLAQSRMVSKIKFEEHGCWTDSCNNDSSVMLEAIKQWKLVREGGSPTPPPPPAPAPLNPPLLIASKVLETADTFVTYEANWSAVEGIIQYRVSAGADSGIYVIPAKNVVGLKDVFMAPRSASDEKSKVCVQSVDGLGNLSSTRCSEFTVPKLPPVAPPENVVLKVLQISDTNISYEVSWTAVKSVTKYHRTAGADSAAFTIPPKEVTGLIDTFSTPRLAADEKSFVCLQSIDASGALSMTRCLSFVVPKIVQPDSVSGVLKPSHAQTLCLDVKGSAKTAGTELQTWSCNGAENQVFTFNGSATIPGEIKVYGSMCLDFGSPALQGAPAKIAGCNGTTSQKFFKTAVGEFRTTNNLCLDVTGSSTSDGGKVIAWTCSGNANQKWLGPSTYVPPVQPPATVTINVLQTLDASVSYEVAWSSVTNVTQYRRTVIASTGAYTIAAKNVIGLKDTFSAPRTSNDENSSVCVQSIDAAGDISATRCVSFIVPKAVMETPPPPPPPPPAPLEPPSSVTIKVLTTTDSSVNYELNWTAVNNITQYYRTAGANSKNYTITPKTVAGLKDTFTAPRLPYDEASTACIQSIDASGSLSATRCVTFTVPKVTVVAAPGTLTIKALETTNSFVTYELAWSAVTDITQYYRTASAVSKIYTVPAKTVTGLKDTFTVSRFTNDENSTACVQSVNAAGTMSATRCVSYTVPKLPVLDPPASVTIKMLQAADTYVSYELSWTAVTGASQYRRTASADSGAFTLPAKNVSTLMDTFMVPRSSIDEKASACVQSIDGMGTLSASRCVAFTVQKLAPPPPPPAPPQKVVDYPVDVLMGGREYAESVLMDIFNAQGTAYESIITAETLTKGEFGGSCDPYAASDLSTSTFEFPREQCYSGVRMVLPANANPMRFAYTTRVCERLIINTDAMNAVKSKIYGTAAWALPDNANIKKAYKLFFPAEEPPVALLDEFRLRSIEAGTTAPEAWKLIMLTLCVNPEWHSI